MEKLQRTKELWALDKNKKTKTPLKRSIDSNESDQTIHQYTSSEVPYSTGSTKVQNSVL